MGRAASLEASPVGRSRVLEGRPAVVCVLTTSPVRTPVLQVRPLVTSFSLSHFRRASSSWGQTHNSAQSSGLRQGGHCVSSTHPPASSAWDHPHKKQRRVTVT